MYLKYLFLSPSLLLSSNGLMDWLIWRIKSRNNNVYLYILLFAIIAILNRFIKWIIKQIYIVF